MLERDMLVRLLKVKNQRIANLELEREQLLEVVRFTEHFFRKKTNMLNSAEWLRKIIKSFEKDAADD